MPGMSHAKVRWWRRGLAGAMFVLLAGVLAAVPASADPVGVEIKASCAFATGNRTGPVLPDGQLRVVAPGDPRAPERSCLSRSGRM